MVWLGITLILYLERKNIGRLDWVKTELTHVVGENADRTDSLVQSKPIKTTYVSRLTLYLVQVLPTISHLLL